jgi:drug/metabolite transporter (DMT)-like permease
VSIFIGVLLLGTGPLFVKTVHANGILVGFYRVLFASLMLTLPVIIFRNRSPQPEKQKMELKWPLLGGLAYALNVGLWCTALNYTTASAVSLLDNAAPVWVGLISWLVLKEKQTWHYWSGLLVTLIGAVLMLGLNLSQGSASQLQGNLVAVASGFSYALYMLVASRALKNIGSLRYSWIVCMISTVILFLAVEILGLFGESLPFGSLMMIFLMALTSQVVAYLLVNYALGRLPVASASVILLGKPVVTTLLGIILIKEIPSWIQLVGGLICLAGIFLVQRSLNHQPAVDPPE